MIRSAVTFLKYSFMALGFFGSLSSYADSCSTIDIRDSLVGEVRQHFATASDQGEIGWCFANATADILTHALGKRVSAVHIGLVYSTNMSGFGAWARNLIGLNSSGFFEGGYEKEAVEILKKHGQVCLDQDVRSVDPELEPYGLRAPFGEYFDSLAAIFSGNESVIHRDWTKELLKGHFPSVDIDGAYQYLLSQKSLGAPLALTNLADASCSANAIQIPKNLKAIKVSKDAGAELLPVINRVLESNNPVSILYFVERIIRTDYRDFASKFVQHTSVIVGRKKVGKQCMYTVRNSWGAGCGLYRDGLTCNEAQGTYEIQGSELEKVGLAVTYIRK